MISRRGCTCGAGMLGEMLKMTLRKEHRQCDVVVVLGIYLIECIYAGCMRIINGF